MLLICCLFGFMSYPTLEAWTFWGEWRRHGAGYYLLRGHEIADRPLHWLPSLAAWLMPGSFDIGSVTVGFFLAVSRWSLAEAIGRVLSFTPGARAVFVFLCVSAPAWQFSGLDRFQPAQLSFSFLLLSWYFLARDLIRPSTNWLVFSWFCVECSLLSYQALLLVILCQPLMALAFPSPMRRQGLKFMLVSWGGVSVYLIYRSIMLRAFPGAYTTVGTALVFKVEYLALLYQTVWKAGLFSLLPIAAILAVMLSMVKSGGTHWRGRAGYATVAVALAPLSGLVYFSAKNWISDPDRVLFPVQVWMIAAFIPMAAFPAGMAAGAGEPLKRACLVVIGAAWAKTAAVMAYCAWIQISLYGSLGNQLIGEDPDRMILLEDQTGICGNFYTGWHVIVDRSAKLLGIPGNFTLCRGIELKHQKAPGPSVPGASPPPCPDCRATGTRLKIVPGIHVAGYPLTVKIVPVPN